jgi:SAM-dependent methyltransferase
MRKVNTKKQVKDFWEGRARVVTESTKVTHPDIWQRWLEIQMIKRFLKKDRVLDIGCGNGHTTRLIAPFVKNIVGIDYSPEMIKRAHAELEKSLAKKVVFEVGDVTKLSPSDFGKFDLAISERCLINLGSWEAQKTAIANIASVVKNGGRYLFVEGCKDGRDGLNNFRKKMGLTKMPKVWHNIDFEKGRTFTYLKKYFKIEKYLHFGIYDFVARVVHPLMVAPKNPTYDSKFNEMAAKLALESQEFGDISRVLFLVLKRKISR